MINPPLCLFSGLLRHARRRVSRYDGRTERRHKSYFTPDIKTIFLTLLLSLFSPMLFAAPAQNIYNFNTVEQQTRFDELTQNLRCLVCQNQTLAESNAPLAQDLRGQIFQMILNQKSNQDIKNYLIQRYGNFVTYTPPFNPSTYLLWGLPGLLLLIGIFIIKRLST